MWDGGRWARGEGDAHTSWRRERLRGGALFWLFDPDANAPPLSGMCWRARMKVAAADTAFN